MPFTLHICVNISDLVHFAQISLILHVTLLVLDNDLPVLNRAVERGSLDFSRKSSGIPPEHTDTANICRLTWLKPDTKAGLIISVVISVVCQIGSCQLAISKSQLRGKASIKKMLP